MKIKHTNKMTFKDPKSMLWKIASLFIVTCFTGIHSSNAQYTTIPDANFEQALVDLGIDTMNGDHKVLTSAISGVTSLNISNRNIADLSGIENFYSLQTLDCSNNPNLINLNYYGHYSTSQFDTTYYRSLTTLNVSGCTSLQTLKCYLNRITSLNVSGCISLTTLRCDGNRLTSLNLNGLPALTHLNCEYNELTNFNASGLNTLTFLNCASNQMTNLNISGLNALTILQCGYNRLSSIDLSGLNAITILDCRLNQLTSLDVSGLTALTVFYCNVNQLSNLNVKNGNNTRLTDVFFRGNYNLQCIQVDDKAYFDARWSLLKDETASYETDCSTMDTETMVLEKMSIYPNPIKEELHIDNIMLQQVTVYDPLGRLVHSAYFDNVSNNNTINLGGLAKGNYYIFIEAQGVNRVKKIIIE
ncbi:T9SS type A sorting domain-containing protein [Flavobacterium sp. SM15]|uniref:T9SS type A sorting domain-containing protein n=1 Tax=Flavobacterium sp. SM15 TaxID=2908005 RepID=UPI001EDB631A|nr:T9SS type A sorting domain-containing protein [Flavobacterium sp. SM15]MCG2611460.1 T9SS type A sorting domain-containing protein [Flavobacterium sp. SM15]